MGEVVEKKCSILMGDPFAANASKKASLHSRSFFLVDMLLWSGEGMGVAEIFIVIKARPYVPL